MELAATLDGERFQEIMNALFNRGAAVVQRYQGTVDKFTRPNGLVGPVAFRHQPH